MSSHDDPWLDLLVIALAAWAILVRAVCCTGYLPAQHGGHSNECFSKYFLPSVASFISCCSSDMGLPPVRLVSVLVVGLLPKLVFDADLGLSN